MPIKRTRNIYDPSSDQPSKLSRSKLESFIDCPRCFYVDRRLGVGRPSMPGFTLNSAVDELFKKEFDQYRADKKPHPIMVEYGIDAIPFSHSELDEWRENFKGIQIHHKPTNLIITGAVDDVWVDPDGRVMVVDYKSTSKAGEVELTDAKWHQAYRRQIEIYQWLLEQKGFEVRKEGYFVYANGIKDVDRFDDILTFKTVILTHEGDSSWVEQAIINAHKCLNQDTVPNPDPDCEYCQYRKAIGELDFVE